MWARTNPCPNLYNFLEFGELPLRGLVGTQIGRSRWLRAVQARVPFTAASVMAQPCRIDGYVATRRRYIPIQTRCETHKAFELSRYMRAKLLVNPRRSTPRAGKVEHMSRALALVALTHLSYMHSEHPFMLELASSPLVKLPCSPPRTIPAFGRLARKGGCKSSSASGSVGSTSARSRPLASCLLWAWAAAEHVMRHQSIDFLTTPCKRCWRWLAAQLAAGRMRAVRMGHAC